MWWVGCSQVSITQAPLPSRINFRGLIPKVFTLTTFQEREYEFHFTDIHPTLLLFPWIFIYPPPIWMGTFDRKTYSRSLFRKRSLWGNSWGLSYWNFNNFVTIRKTFQKPMKILRYARSLKLVNDKSIGIGVQNSSCSCHRRVDMNPRVWMICALLLSYRNILAN